MLRIFLNMVLSLVLGKLKDFVIEAVTKLSTADNLTNEEKRKLAFEQIKAQAITAGKDLRDSLINLVIEAAVQLIKKN